MTKIPFFDPAAEAKRLRNDHRKHCKNPKTASDKEWCERIARRADELEREAAK
jgi:hypothetical protein